MIHKSFLPISVLLTIVLSTLVILPNQVVSAGKTPKKSVSSWEKILHALFSHEPPGASRIGGSRGDGLCMISPGVPSLTRIVWSDRPLFIWQKLGDPKVSKIQIEDSDHKSLWDTTVNTTQHQIAYKGKPLQPGQIYRWNVFLGGDDQHSTSYIDFQIMGSPERDRITAQLKGLANQLKAKHRSPEAIALTKTEYFAQHNLWSDVLQQMYSVSKPSAQLRKIVEKLPDHLCEKPVSQKT